MSNLLTISDGTIVTADGSTLSFADKNLSITGYEIRSGNASITLNNSSSGLSFTAGGIEASSGLSILPNSSAPSSAASGYSVTGLGLSGLQPVAPEITGVAQNPSVSDQIKINFALSTINVGSPITSVTFKAYKNGQFFGEQTTQTLTSPYEYNGLAVGNTYTFRVTTSTSTRTSGLSNESSSILLGTVPDAPSNLELSFGSEGKWILVWDRPYDGGAPIDYSQTQFRAFSLFEDDVTKESPMLLYGFQIADSADLSVAGKARNGYGYTSPSIPIVYSARDYSQPINPDTGRAYLRTSVSSVANEGTYGFSVRVRNSIGWSDWSAMVKTDYYPPPSNLIIQNVSTGTGPYSREYALYVMLVGSTNPRFKNLVKFDVQIKKGFASDNNVVTTYENYPINMTNVATQFTPYRPLYNVQTLGFAVGDLSMPRPTSDVIDIASTNQYSMRIRASNPKGTSEWTSWYETLFF